jgi:hypothetical protein
VSKYLLVCLSVLHSFIHSFLGIHSILGIRVDDYDDELLEECPVIGHGSPYAAHVV